MFGRPEWFKTRTISVRTPACLAGWLYLTGWGTAIGLPSWLFLDAGRIPEAVAWLAVSSVACFWDCRHSRRTAAAMNGENRAASTSEPLRTAPSPPPVVAETPHYISDALPEITFLSERTNRVPRRWMPWPRRFRV